MINQKYQNQNMAYPNAAAKAIVIHVAVKPAPASVHGPLFALQLSVKQHVPAKMYV